MEQSGRRRFWLAVSGALGLAADGPASAQVCVQDSVASTHCRLMLSRPQAFTVEAGVLTRRGEGRSGLLALTVDGRGCAARETPLNNRVLASCRVSLSAGEHDVSAALKGPATPLEGVGLRLAPSSRLADLPHDTQSLVPPRAKRLRWPW